ncbi:amidase signature enzyme [Podospora australis]|uniref:Amidase signature enzyme n=1 Tax=Podospora australis TaxID=1536484 RepID=A0AAN6WYL9_9PEZI|nr:amidase signature enzyme [Podospora australis]
MERDDDVYRQDPFLQRLVITNVAEGKTLTDECRGYIAGLGPYLLANSKLKPVCRLYGDHQHAFLATLKPYLADPAFEDVPPHLQLKAAGTSYDCLAVAVPSRCPEILSGGERQLRVAVKDIFRVKGLQTSLNNKAYYSISEPAKWSADLVDSLVVNKAHIVGLTKLSSMIHAREEPMDAVDFLTPFNPRGDGYQSPAGSSSSSAAAVASYDWLDGAIGTDTSGSGRRPAMANGIWQFRPSHDSCSLEEVVTTFPLFDPPVVFSRDFGNIRQLLDSAFDEIQTSGWSSGKAYEVLYLQEYLPVPPGEQMQLIDDFIQDLRLYLPDRDCQGRPVTITKLSLREACTTTHPSDTPDDLDFYLQNVIQETYHYEYNQSSEAFREQYAADHNGSPPYVIPSVQRRWAKGAAVTPAQNEEALNKLAIYKNWLQETLFERGTEALVVLPVANAEPNYRDTVTPSPEDQSALDELFLSPILGAPDIVVPLGDISYQSRITNKVEYLPVVANLVAAPGKDHELLRVVETILSKSGRPTVVAMGSRMFPGVL